GIEVGNNHTDVGLLAGGGQEVGECAGGDVRHGACADRAGGEVFEVGRHFIQQAEDGVFAFEQFGASPFLRGPPAGKPTILATGGPAELLGDVAPEEVRRAVAAVEG